MNPSHNTVLITGGTSGIGLALAKRFLKESNRVIITGRSQERLARVQAELPEAMVQCADLNDPQTLEQLAGCCADVNILINNAGIQLNYEFADQSMPTHAIESELQTNLLGPLLLIKLMLPNLLARESAAIVNVSSGLGIVPKQSAPVYCASKAGLHVFTKALRWQLENTYIKVFEIIPPLVDTPMSQRPF